jgi:hypothetical protein
MRAPVEKALRALAKIHADRHAVYGDDYLHAGEVMIGYFPQGLHLKTPEDFNRFVLFVHMSTKMGRYAQALVRGSGHPDSLDDLSVYAQLEQNSDSRARSTKVDRAREEPVDREETATPPRSRKSLARSRRYRKVK